MPGSSAGSTSIFRNASGIFVSPLSRSTRPHYLANPSSDYLGLSAGGIRFTLPAKNEGSNKQRARENGNEHRNQNSNIHPRVDPGVTEHKAQRIVEERTWLGEMQFFRKIEMMSRPVSPSEDMRPTFPRARQPNPRPRHYSQPSHPVAVRH